MTPKTYTVYHVEDEPERNEWIPSMIFDDLTENNYSMLANADKYFKNRPAPHADERAQWFEIDYMVDGNLKFKFHYNFINEIDLFNPIDKSAVWIVDLMRINENGALFNHGETTIHRLLEKGVAPERIFIMTGYPGYIVGSCKSIPEQNIFIKPIDERILINRIKSLHGINP